MNALKGRENGLNVDYPFKNTLCSKGGCMKILKTLALIPALFIFIPVVLAASTPKECGVELNADNPDTGKITISDNDSLRVHYTIAHLEGFQFSFTTKSTAKKVDSALIIYPDIDGNKQFVKIKDTSDNLVQLLYNQLKPTGDIIITNLGDKHHDNSKPIDEDDFSVRGQLVH